MFNSLFGGSQEKKQIETSINWISITHIDQLNEIIALSNQKPVVIFKHSTRCSISRTVLKQFEREFNLANETETYFLDLLKYRSISNEIANQFNVFHQSPQLLLIKNGKSLYNASHSDIDASELAKKI